MRSKKLLSLCLCALCLTGAARAEIALSGTVAAREAAAVTANIGGSVEEVFVRAGDRVEEGDVVATVALTGIYAPADGTVRGIMAEAGDSAGQTVLSIAPMSKYTVTADISDAYDSAANKHVTVGETVYMECSRDGSHVAVGRVVKAEGSAYTVEVTGGELYMEETVYIYRDEDHSSSARIGSGTVSRTAELAVSGTGRVAELYVSEGERVERGQLLFTCVEADTVEDALLGGEIRSTASGVVASVAAQAGQQAAVGSTVLTVYPTEGFCVELSVEEADLAAVNVGDSVRLSFDFDAEGALTCEGTVTEISYLGESTEAGTVYTAYVDFDAPEDVRLGMTVTATVIADE